MQNFMVIQVLSPWSIFYQPSYYIVLLVYKCHEWYLCQKSSTNHGIISLYYYPQRSCNFHVGISN